MPRSDLTRFIIAMAATVPLALGVSFAFPGMPEWACLVIGVLLGITCATIAIDVGRGDG